MELNIKTNTGELLKIGDQVEILRFCDDSGNATDLYGVETHLNAWVNICYVENFKGEIVFCENKLMVVIRSKHVDIPLSYDIRYDLYFNLYENIITEGDLKIAMEENNLPDHEYETFINYIVKV